MAAMKKAKKAKRAVKRRSVKRMATAAAPAINPKVVDLSHYDDVTDKFAGAVRFGIRGVINKASEGRGMIDQSFNWRRQPAHDAGLLYGAYHFLRPGGISMQVELFLKAVGNTDKLLLACDHEDRNVPIAAAQEWCDTVRRKVGRLPVLYSGFLIKEQADRADASFWRKVRLWLAHYSSRPAWPTRIWPNEPWLWQYTGDGVGPAPHNVPGIVIGGGLDISSYAGDDATLAKEWAT